MTEKLINFPEDRSLYLAQGRSTESIIEIPYVSHARKKISPEIYFVRELATSIFYIFNRINKIDDAYIKFNFMGDLKADGKGGAVESPSSPYEKYYAISKISADENINKIFQNVEAVECLPLSGLKININLYDEEALKYLKIKSCAHENLLTYKINNNSVSLTLKYRGNSVARVTAEDFLEKIKLLIGQLINGINFCGDGLSLVTSKSMQFIPDLKRAIDKINFEPIPVKFFEVSEVYSKCKAVAGPTSEYDYEHLKNKTIQIINELINIGVSPGDVIAIRGVSSFGTIASILAIMSVGGILVIIDNLLPDERKVLIEKTSRAKYYIDVSDDYNKTEASGNIVRTQEWPSNKDILSVDVKPTLGSSSEYDCAYIFFTSGSSGSPKGVLGSHQGLAHFLEWQRTKYPIGPGDRTAQITALSFDVVLRDIFYPLTSGACIHIPARGIFLDAKKMLEWVKTTKITALHCVPSLMKAWLLADTGDQAFKSLKYIFFAGEPLTDSLLNKFRAASGEATVITNLYGPTETTLAKLFNNIEHIEAGVQPIGIPQPGVEVLIMKDRKTICGLWETGEIAIRTPYRSKGYYENSVLTHQAFEKNIWSEDAEDLIYFTGDLGRYRSDGKVEIFGRIDSQIKIRGVRIEPNEIEACILSFPRMKDAAVTTRYGLTGDKILLAVVVPDSFENFNSLEQAHNLRTALKEKLQDAMVPGRIIFMERLPYLPNGKLDRKSIGSIDFQQNDEVKSDGSVNLPKNEKMRRIIDEIEDTLGIKVYDLSHSFVDLGGDSLSFIRISVAIEDTFGVLPLDWEKIPLSVLESNMVASEKKFENDGRSRWVSMEPSVVLRAIAILFVVLGHATGFDLIGTSTLFLISGMSFGKFLQRDILDGGSVIPSLKFILKFGVPAGLWEALAVATNTHVFWIPDYILMGTYFHNPKAVYFTLWYLDVLAANILVISIILLVSAKLLGSKVNSKSAFSIDYILIIVGLLISFIQVGTGWWDGALGETSVGPLKWLWLIAFGAAVANAKNLQEKLILSLLLCAMIIVKLANIPLITGSFSLIDSFFFVSAILLVWFARIFVPRILRSTLINVATASLFIYIVNYTVLKKVSSILNNESYWPIAVVCAMVSGVVFSWFWTKLDSLTRSTVGQLKGKYSQIS